VRDFLTAYLTVSLLGVAFAVCLWVALPIDTSPPPVDPVNVWLDSTRHYDSLATLRGDSLRILTAHHGEHRLDCAEGQ